MAKTKPFLCKVFHSAFTLIHIPDLITICQSIELFNIVIVVPISKDMFDKKFLVMLFIFFENIYG